MQELYFNNQVCDSELVNYFDLLSQNLIEARIPTMEYRKDDARRLKKQYTKEINVHLKHMFYEASQQPTLPAEQRTLMPELLCGKLGVEKRKFEPRLYLEDIKAKIEISYSRDIVMMIAEHKAVARSSFKLLWSAQSQEVQPLNLLFCH